MRIPTLFRPFANVPADACPATHPVAGLGRQIGAVLVILSLVICTDALAQNKKKEPVPQDRPSMTRVDVPLQMIDMDDGDTIVIHWSESDIETVRILGIDTPETRHLAHNIPHNQPFGEKASGFAKGAFAMASKVEVLRSATLDPYGRTLGYLYINGINFAASIVRAGLAAESISAFGDNGLPDQAQEVLAAAEEAGPLPFEPPYLFRRRMKEYSGHLKALGKYPGQEKDQ